jgi:hypothetical protein
MPTPQGLGGNLWLLIGVRTLSLLRSRLKDPPIHMLCDLHRSKFMMKFSNCFTIGKAHE